LGTITISTNRSQVAWRTQATREPLHLRSDGQRANPRRDVGEHRGDVGTGQLHRAIGDERDQRDQQRILEQVLAGGIALQRAKTSDHVHDFLPDNAGVPAAYAPTGSAPIRVAMLLNTALTFVPVSCTAPYATT